MAAADLSLHSAFSLLGPYLGRVVPAAPVVLAAVWACRSRTTLRIALLVLLFVLLRDAMTPARLWSIDAGLTMRFTHSAGALLALTAASLGIVWALRRFEPLASASGARWRSTPSDPRPQPLLVLIGWGTIGAVVIVLPTVLLSLGARFLLPRLGWDALPPVPPPAPQTLLPFLVTFSLCGNALEELLFRGVLQGHLEATGASARDAALGSALAFSAAHVLLAAVVTSAGLPLLLFTAFEGYVAAEVRNRAGLLGATVAHGGAIFLLSSGLLGT